MRFGLSLPHYDFSLPGVRPVTFDALAQHAVRAEELGFDSVWVSDHFFYSLARYGARDELLGSLEPLTALAGLAVRTRRVRLGTLVLGAPFRHPSILAKSATTIDVLSHGRLDLGLGAGWYRDEFEAFGYAFGEVGDRFAALEDAAATLDALLPGGPVTLDVGAVHLVEAFNRPRPVQQPRPPIWIGAIRLVARHADGWNSVWRWAPEAFGARMRRARELAEEAGRDPSTVRFSVGLYTVVGEDERDAVRRWGELERWMPGVLAGQSMQEWRADALVGSVEDVRERIAAFEALGVEEIVVAPAPLPFAIPDPSMVELFAEAVIGAR
jgi:alkanesulfonate monooxygenase SsuD/methylene tetrahydromethanopterin reductase-like flavin-dependent oxidoreductase (luciferase family)